MMHIFREQCGKLAGDSIDIPDMLEYIDQQKDYDVSAQKPVPGPYVKRDRGDDVVEYCTRLEDIDRTWVAKYVENSLIGYKINTGGRARRLAAMRSNITYRDDEGKMTDETELEADYDNSSGYDIIAAKNKLPYLLKKLHLKSKILKTSIISIYGVYLSLLQSSNGKQPKPGAMLEHTIWRMDENGNITTPYTASANHNRGFPQAFEFIRGANPRDPFYQDLVEFGQVCEALGITLWNEDPTEFDQKFINSLTVTYMKSNSDFMWHGRSYDNKVLQAIRDTSMSDWAPVVSGPQVTNLVYSMVVRVSDSTDRGVKNIIQQYCSQQQFDYFFYLYSFLSKDPNFIVSANTYRSFNPKEKYRGGDRYPNLNCLSTADDFFCMPGTNVPFTFSVGKFTSHDANAVAILHASGNLFVVSSMSTVQYCHLSEFVSWLQAYGRMKDNAIGTVTQSGGVVGKWKQVRI